MRNFLIFILFIQVGITSCLNKGDNCEKRMQKETQTLKKELNIENEKKQSDINKYQIVQLDDGDILNVISSYYSGNKKDTILDFIDSLSISKKHFKGRYLSCFKGYLDINLFKELERRNSTDFHEIVNITTAHSIILEKDTVHFNGRNKVEIIREKNVHVIVNCSIYSLFANKDSITSVLIIDEIKGVD